MAQDFLTDIKTLRERARQHIENGAVTEGYKADRQNVIRLLNEALANGPSTEQPSGSSNRAAERFDAVRAARRRGLESAHV